MRDIYLFEKYIGIFIDNYLNIIYNNDYCLNIIKYFFEYLRS